MSLKNVMVAQSGGPTVAINASLAGVIRGVMASDQYETVYGSVNGILGILNNHLLNLTEIMNENPAYLDRLETTPAMYLGSCRHKLPDYLDDDSSYVFIFKQFELYNVGAFFYIGGNDSMDTVLKLSEYGRKIGSDVRIIGIPKTIDNDLCETDHTPGFGSAAKYIASSVLEIAHDTFIYAVKSVTIIEIMGRDAGWLTAAAALARNGYNSAPHLIYLPEVPFDTDDFLLDVKRMLFERNNVIIAVSEGIRDASGNYISASEKWRRKNIGIPCERKIRCKSPLHRSECITAVCSPFSIQNRPYGICRIRKKSRCALRGRRNSFYGHHEPCI